MIADERLARVQVIDHGEPLFIELVHRHGREQQATDPEMKGGAIGVGYQRVRCLLDAVVQEADSERERSGLPGHRHRRREGAGPAVSRVPVPRWRPPATARTRATASSD